MRSGDESCITQLAAEIARRADEDGKRRLMVAIAGGPASGKSTLGTRLVQAINAACGEGRAVYVPMDGFHKSTARLTEEGMLDLKGRPETFDADALLLFLKRLARGEEQVSGPEYSREIHDVVQDAYTVKHEDIAIVEGNYLLLDGGTWNEVSALFDYKIFVRTSEATAVERLRARHRAGGKSAAWTEDHIQKVDVPNHRLVSDAEHRADVVIEGE